MGFRLFSSAEQWCERLGPSRPATTLTVGNFDGLHLGHQRLLAGVVARARADATMAAAVTFDPHPLRVLRPEAAEPLITPLEDRLAGFAQTGLDAALLLRFDAPFSRLSPEEFVAEILVRTLRAARILVGENFRFGHRHAGDVALLRTLGGRHGFVVETVPPVVVRGLVVSSTAIRAAVRQGRMSRAARLLGRPFSLTGAIEPGTGRGRTLLVPTLNLAPREELLPKTGVYATETLVDGRRYPSATNVGLRPTFDGRHLTVESHLFDFAPRVAQGPVEVRFWRRLRDEVKFTSVEELRAQIQRDLERARSFFRRLARDQASGLPRPGPRAAEPA